MHDQEARWSRASGGFLALAVILIAPLVFMSLQGVRNADALNYLGALLLPVIGLCVVLSVGLSIRAIRRGRKSLRQYLILAVALGLLILPFVLAALAP